MSEGIYREMQNHDDDDFNYKNSIYISFTQEDEYHIEEKLPLSCVHTGKYSNGCQFAGYYAFLIRLIQKYIFVNVKNKL